MDWWSIATGVFIVISAIVSIRWIAVKNFLKETAEALTCVSLAIEDDEITEEEAHQIVSEWLDVIEAAKDIAGK